MESRTIAGRYQLLEKIGEGAARRVYRANDTQLGRTVALKLMEELSSEDLVYAQSFDSEVRQAAELSHPRLLTAHDYRLNDYLSAEAQECYFATEYMPRSLKEYLAGNGGPLTEGETRRLMTPVLEALSAAHLAGLAHGYLKPQNVLLTGDNTPMVADLAVAKAVAAREATLPELFYLAGAAGNFDYTSPEQVRGQTPSPRSDVYSAGVMMYEMLTGAPPFVADDPLKVSYAHVFEEPRPIGEVAPDISPEMAALVERAMAKDPDRRFADASEMLDALRAPEEVVEPMESSTRAEAGETKDGAEAGEARFHAGYRLGEPVGRGGFAYVYRTARGEDDPDLCIKIGYSARGGSSTLTRLPSVPESPTVGGLSPDEAPAIGVYQHTGAAGFGSVPAEGVKAVLASEFALLESLSTDLTPRVFDIGESRGVPYYVMEYIEGSSLRARLRHRETLDFDLLGMFAKLLEDLLELQASQEGFYHGDLKPENMILTPDRFRLVDPAMRAGDGHGLSGTITVAYNPLALRGERADTFSISTVLFEILTDQQPFGEFREPWLGDLVAIGGDEAQETARKEEFLNLGRFDGYHNNRLLGQLLDWMSTPPGYAEMHAVLQRFQAGIIEEEDMPEEEAPVATDMDFQTIRMNTPRFDTRSGPRILSLEVSAGPDAGETFKVSEAGAVVGRLPENEISISDGKLSRRHAQIEFRDGSFWITDLGSANGTWINEARITEPHELQTDDVLQVGVSRFTVNLEE